MSSATITTSARLMNFTPQTEEQAMVRKVAVSSFLGNFIEWFDYASYSYFATTIALVFFPTDNHTVAMLQTFGVFALSFILRPIGALFWGSYGDKKGRKAALAHSIMFMSGASFLIGCLPSYSVIGVGRRFCFCCCAWCKASPLPVNMPVRPHSSANMHPPQSVASTAR